MWIGGTLRCAAGAAGAWQLGGETAESFSIVLGVLTVVYAASYPQAHRATIERNARAYARNMGTRGVVGEIKLILSEESLVEVTEIARSEVRWAVMQGVEEV